MKITKRILGVFVICFMILNCKNENAQNNIPETELIIPNLSLNNGKRWQANNETTKGISAMIHILDSTTLKETLVTNVKVLLEKEFDLLVANCTMKGEPHNQLHNYILPLKEKIEHLDENKGHRSGVDNVHTHLQAYSEYFE